jgi:hypothetical protein
MPNYTKLFNSIVTSTIWTEDDQTRIVWITMLAISDQNGEVQASIPGLARVAGISIEATETALNKFMSPDSYSRTPDDEGRRIEKIEGGWALLNHAKYRAMASKEDAKLCNAKRQARKREKDARNASVTPSGDCHGIVTHSNASVTQSRDIAEAEAEADTKKTIIHKTKNNRAKFIKPTIDQLRTFCKEIGHLESDGDHMFYKWEEIGWKNGSRPVVSWQSGIMRYASAGWLPSQKAKQSKPTSTHHDRHANDPDGGVIDFEFAYTP